MSEWFGNPAADMVDDAVLHKQVCSVMGFRNEKRILRLEPKDQVRKRLGNNNSPDHADGAALTFAFEVYKEVEKKPSWRDTLDYDDVVDSSSFMSL
jgi:hypothetical protein